MKMYWGVDVPLYSFLTAALQVDGGGWSVSLSDRFTPRERAIGNHRTGRQGLLRPGLDVSE